MLRTKKRSLRTGHSKHQSGNASDDVTDQNPESVSTHHVNGELNPSTA